MYLTIFGDVRPIVPYTFAKIIQRYRTRIIGILYYSLGRGRRRDINYTLKPIFSRAFPFLVIEVDVFGRFFFS